MRIALSVLLLLTMSCTTADEPVTQFEPNWESIRTHTVPEWFHDAKFGIFVHWGLYSVPAWATPTGELHQVDPDVWFPNNPYAEWYLNTLRNEGSPTEAHHIATYGADFDYYDFAPMFNEAIQSWDPDAMAGLFADVGAQYVVLVSKHHDGFTLWPSDVPNPNLPPEKSHAARDIVGELTEAVRARGMRMGLYYSGSLDWSFDPNPIRTRADVAEVINTDEYAAYADAHWRELIDSYQPTILWNDIGYPEQGDLAQIIADYYNRFPEGLINDRFRIRRENAPPRHRDFTTPEYSRADDITDHKWESTRGLGYSFGYNQVEGPEQTIGEAELIHLLIDIVSKNGNLLLNVGPMADGSIPAIQVERIRALGDWLRVNGDAIYGTRPWERAEGVTSGGIDVRFTRKGDAVYAILLGRPQGGEVTIGELPVPAGATVSLLGRDGALEHRAEGGNLMVVLPVELPESHAYALRIGPGV